jgi:cell division protein ZapA (FtsZ GTPase activity inhibitor)
MSTENNALKHTVIGTVLGGIILAVIQWATGYVTKVLSWLWSQLNTKVVLDVWLLVLAGILLILYVVITTRRTNGLASKVASHERTLSERQMTTSTLRISERELEALKQHADLQPNYGVTASTFAEDSSIHKQEAQYILDSLSEKRLIEYAFDADTGEDAYQLTKTGRKYLVENGYLVSPEMKNT